MERLEVGKVYMGQRRWQEGVQYNYDAGGHILQIFFAAPTAAEVEAVRRGKVELALYTTSDASLLLLVYRMGEEGAGIPWSDAPYSWHRVPAARRTLPPELEGEQRPVLEIHLVDAATGILRAIRQVSLTPAFGQALHNAICAQAQTTYDALAYEHRLDQLQARLDSASMAGMAKVRCVAGQ